MKPEINIQNRVVGEQHPPLIIAELGINHQGSLQTAFEMVDAAFEAGAECIKHQTHIVEDEMSFDAKKVIPGNSRLSIYDIISQCALSENKEWALKDYVESKGMIFISTPFSRAAANRLEKMNVPAFKIGSGEMNNFPLLDHIASFGKPMIVSTGMNNLDSVGKAVEILERRNVQYALLHTTNIYPTPPELVRLGALKELESSFPNAVIGLSDHTVNNNACIAAIALGSSIVERHFTDSKKRSGPDIVNSMDPFELKELLQASKEIYKMRGGTKKALAEEQVTADFAFATVVAITNIKKGEIFSKENIWVKRPGTGEVKAEQYEKILGKKCLNDIEADTHIKFSDIE